MIKRKLLIIVAVFASFLGGIVVACTCKYFDLEKIKYRFESRPRLASMGSSKPPYSQDYDFTQDWFTNNILVWEKALHSFKGKPNIHYLEIGLFEGGSAVWMLENILTHPTARLTGLDIFSGNVKERFMSNIERCGAEDKVKTIIGSSQVELRKLPIDSVDILYIDGSHFAKDVLEDVVLSWRLLKEGGILIFDDYLWCLGIPSRERPKAAIDIFMKYFGKHFYVIHNDYQIILKKR